MNAHPLNQCGCDPLGIDHGFICCDIEMQVPLMNPTETTQIRPKRRAGPFTGVAVHFASAVAIVITGPFADTVAHRGMGRMAAVIALPFIGVQDRALQRDILGDQGSTRTPVRMVADPKTLLPRLARDQTDDGGTIIGVGPVPLPPIGATAGRGGRVSMRRAFFPPHSGTAHQLQRRSPPSQPSGPSR